MINEEDFEFRINKYLKDSLTIELQQYHSEFSNVIDIELEIYLKDDLISSHRREIFK